MLFRRTLLLSAGFLGILLAAAGGLCKACTVQCRQPQHNCRSLGVCCVESLVLKGLLSAVSFAKRFCAPPTSRRSDQVMSHRMITNRGGESPVDQSTDVCRCVWCAWAGTQYLAGEPSALWVGRGCCGTAVLANLASTHASIMDASCRLLRCGFGFRFGFRVSWPGCWRPGFKVSGHGLLFGQLAAQRLMATVCKSSKSAACISALMRMNADSMSMYGCCVL